MSQIASKPLLVAGMCVISIVVLIVVAVQALRPEAPSGLSDGTWTATGSPESVPDAPATPAGNARLDELVSFEIQDSSQENPFVTVILTYRDGKNVAVTASSDMQAGYLQATLTSATGASVPVVFRKKGGSSTVEITDGQMLARFDQ